MSKLNFLNWLVSIGNIYLSDHGAVSRAIEKIIEK